MTVEIEQVKKIQAFSFRQGEGLDYGQPFGSGTPPPFKQSW